MSEITPDWVIEAAAEAYLGAVIRIHQTYHQFKGKTPLGSICAALEKDFKVINEGTPWFWGKRIPGPGGLAVQEVINRGELNGANLPQWIEKGEAEPPRLQMRIHPNPNFESKGEA